ncbi:MAG: hypothetical protein ACOYNI_03045 [Acidimicrobiia bacterium]
MADVEGFDAERALGVLLDAYLAAPSAARPEARRAFVDRVREQLGPEDLAEDTRQLERRSVYLAMRNDVLTAALRTRLEEWGPGSLINHARTELGVAADTQQPYDLLVVDAHQYYSESSIDTEAQAREHANHQQLVELDAPTEPFTSVVDGRPPLMVFRREIAERMLQIDRPADLTTDTPEWYALTALGHEYAHTQRQARVGGHGSVGQVLDELMVDQAANGSNYLAERHLRDIVGVIAGFDLTALIAEAGRAQDPNAVLLPALVDRLGAQTTAMLYAIRPSNYGDEQSIAPELRGAGHPYTALVEHVIADQRARLGRDVVEARLDAYVADRYGSDPERGRAMHDAFDSLVFPRPAAIKDRAEATLAEPKEASPARTRRTMRQIGGPSGGIGIG